MDSVLDIRNNYLKKWLKENEGELGALQQSKYSQFAQWYHTQKVEESREAGQELFCQGQGLPAYIREGDGC